jgi:hypothetical protein
MEQRIECDTSLLEECEAVGIFSGFDGDPPELSLYDLALIAFECGRVALPEPLIEGIIRRSVVRTVANLEERDLFSSHNNLNLHQGVVGYPSACTLDVILKTPGDTISNSSAEEGTCIGTVAWVRGSPAGRPLLAWGLLGGQGESGATSTDVKPRRRAVIIPVVPKESAKACREPLELTVTVYSLSLVHVPCIVLSARTSKLLESVCEVMQACDAAGISDKVISMTKEYVCTREQFGVPVGGFQAVQHALADACVQASSLRSLANFAAWALTESPEQVPFVARAASLAAASIAPAVCETGIQLHGGIGFTWEYDLHLFLRRARAISATCGDTPERVQELLMDYTERK